MPWKPITYTNTDDSLMAMLLFEDKAILLCNCSTTFFYWCWKAVIILVSNRKFVDTFSLLFFFFFVSSAVHEVDLILGAGHRCSTDKHEKRGFFFFIFFFSSRFSLRKLQTILTHVQWIEKQGPIYKKSLSWKYLKELFCFFCY